MSVFFAHTCSPLLCSLNFIFFFLMLNCTLHVLDHLHITVYTSFKSNNHIISIYSHSSYSASLCYPFTAINHIFQHLFHPLILSPQHYHTFSHIFLYSLNILPSSPQHPLTTTPSYILSTFTSHHNIPPSSLQRPLTPTPPSPPRHPTSLSVPVVPSVSPVLRVGVSGISSISNVSAISGVSTISSISDVSSLHSLSGSAQCAWASLLCAVAEECEGNTTQGRERTM